MSLLIEIKRLLMRLFDLLERLIWTSEQRGTLASYVGFSPKMGLRQNSGEFVVLDLRVSARTVVPRLLEGYFSLRIYTFGSVYVAFVYVASSVARSHVEFRKRHSASSRRLREARFDARLLHGIKSCSQAKHIASSARK